MSPGIPSCDEQLGIKSHLTHNISVSLAPSAAGPWHRIAAVMVTSCTKALWCDAAVVRPPLRNDTKGWAVPKPQRVLSFCPFQKTPLQTLSQPGAGSTAPCPGPAFARAARGARGCSLGDYDSECRAVTCVQCPVPAQGTAATALCHCHSQTCSSALLTHHSFMGKMLLPASKGQQGSASQVRLKAVLLLDCLRFLRA